MIDLHEVSGKTAATAATIDVAVAALWNPSTTATIFLLEFHLFKLTVGAADEPKIRRISARGTASTTATPTIANDYDHRLASPAGALLDLSFSAQPTFVGTSGSGGDLRSMITPAAIGTGIMWAWREGVAIRPGAGIAIATGIALAFPVSRVTAVWSEA